MSAGAIKVTSRLLTGALLSSRLDIDQIDSVIRETNVPLPNGSQSGQE